MQDFLGQFLDPPLEHRPRVWWHWMNGNIDAEGLLADLAWMSKVGIGGVQIFEGGMGAAQVVADRVVYRSDTWFELFALAVKEADRLGIEVSVASSAGWSVMGAPWVKPADAMKKLVWSETQVEGGQTKLDLNPLPSNEGSFQDAPRWGRNSKHNFSRDFVCLAVPDDGRFTPLSPNTISLSREYEGDLHSLSDSSYASWVSLPKIVDAEDQVFCDYEFESAVSVGSATIGISGPTGFGSPQLPKAQLESSADGISFELVAEFPMETTMGQSGEVAARTVSFPAVTAKFFRLRLSSSPMSKALPPLEQGVAGLPFKPAGFDRFHISEFALFSGGKVHAFEYKAGFGIAKDYFSLEVDPGHPDLLSSSEIIDVTRFFDPESSTLSWAPESGRWRVFRIGYSLTGAENGPAPEEATGLEVDKLDRYRVQNYLSQFFEPLLEGLEAKCVSRSKVKGFLSDSIESKAQNFTESLAKEFEARRGYNPLPWLLTMTGWVIDDVTETDRFLFDYRLTLTELVSECMYSLLGDYAREHQGIYYSEALESHRPQLGDDLVMRSKADVPMGAMWSWAEGSLPIQTYIADLKGASSVSHIFGKQATGCESFSAYGKPFSFSPKTLKKVADLELALGVTLFNIHSSPHQPKGVMGPGVTLAPTLGQVFTRNETWADSSGAWVDYLARCSLLLNSGSPKADLLYYTGEEAPVTAQWGDDEFDVPSGYDFDLVSGPALNQISAQDGQLVSSQAQYKLLYLGGQSNRMSLPVIEKLVSLAQAGAKIFGAVPESTPGVAGQANFTEALERLTSNSNFTACSSLTEALAIAESKNLVAKDWRLFDSDRELTAALVPDADARCIRRTGADFDLYFVANARNRRINLALEVSAQRRFPYLLNPISPELSMRIRPNNEGQFELELEPYGSRFLYLSDTEIDLTALGARDKTVTQTLSSVEIKNWTAEIGDHSIDVGAVFDWSKGPADEVRYHSGSVAFSTSVEIADPLATHHLVFEDIAELAEVFVNGKSAGTAWSFGHRIDISTLVTQGQNQIKLVITNNWRNRLLGDQLGKPRLAGSNPTYIGYPIFNLDAETLPSGILRPVKLESSQ